MVLLIQVRVGVVTQWDHSNLNFFVVNQRAFGCVRCAALKAVIIYVVPHVNQLKHRTCLVLSSVIYATLVMKKEKIWSVNRKKKKNNISSMHSHLLLLFFLRNKDCCSLWLENTASYCTLLSFVLRFLFLFVCWFVDGVERQIFHKVASRHWKSVQTHTSSCVVVITFVGWSCRAVIFFFLYLFSIKCSILK